MSTHRCARKGKERKDVRWPSCLNCLFSSRLLVFCLFVFFWSALALSFFPTGPSVVVNLLLVVLFGQLTPVVLILFHNGT